MSTRRKNFDKRDRVAPVVPNIGGTLMNLFWIIFSVAILVLAILADRQGWFV